MGISWKVGNSDWAQGKQIFHHQGGQNLGLYFFRKDDYDCLY